jgi:regulator of sigma E protease
MESILHSIQEVSSYAIPMIVLLGLLIFVHELGHFLVAKYFKVRVEVFSLGFGPKILKHKRGDTVYAISAVPLGGYVKMFGDDPSAEISADQKAFSFLHKPVGQRIAVVLAGPIMNLLFAILLFMSVSLLGEQSLIPVIGDVPETSPAWTAGFRSGDLVVKAGDRPIKTWEDFQKVVEASGNKPLRVEVEREGAITGIKITPKLVPNKNVLSWDRQVGEIEGVSYSSHAPAVGIRDPKSVAARSGLQTGDVITAIDGVKVEKWRDVLAEIAKRASLDHDKVQISYVHGTLDLDKKDRRETEPEPKQLMLTIPKDAKGKAGNDLAQTLGIEFPELYLVAIEPDSSAAQAGLQKGDRLVSINGTEVQSFEQVAGIIRSFGKQAAGGGENSTAASGESATGPLNIVISRDGEEKEIAVSPNLKQRMNQQGKEERRFEIGIRPMIVEAAPATFAYRASGPIEAFMRGLDLTARWTNLTILSFVRMFQAEVSAKNLGGFLSIGQMAKRSWQVGPAQFLMAMAIISINLFILNLLPVPVLDGGHLVFYTIEAIKGAPLSMRKMELAQQVGIVLLLGLMAFALFNDFSRLFGGNW